jgi:hypothetical protein
MFWYRFYQLYLSITLLEYQYAEINEPRHDKNKHNGFATSMDPYQPAHPRSLITIHAVRYKPYYK